MHEYREFPKWKYHAEKPAVIVEDARAEAVLGAGWRDSPVKGNPVSPPPFRGSPQWIPRLVSDAPAPVQAEAPAPAPVKVRKAKA